MNVSTRFEVRLGLKKPFRFLVYLHILRPFFEPPSPCALCALCVRACVRALCVCLCLCACVCSAPLKDAEASARASAEELKRSLAELNKLRGEGGGAEVPKLREKILELAAEVKGLRERLLEVTDSENRMRAERDEALAEVRGYIFCFFWGG